MAIIYFGGNVLTADSTSSLPLSYTEQTNLDSLSPEGFRVAFHEWITQCWLHDNTVPNDSESLKNFDINTLIPQFRAKYVSGDWRRMRPRPVTVEEYLLFLQLILQSPLTLALNQDQPQQPMGRVRYILKLSSYQIGACLLSQLINGSKVLSPSEMGLPVMIYDGYVGHVITVYTVDKTRQFISYDDPTWRSGKSMLCKGENQAGIDAHFIGDTEVGHWAVHSALLSQVIYGVPIPQNMAEVWENWAAEAVLKLKKMPRLFQ